MKPKRLPIPQALRIAVLVEAGYRCAVPTRHTTLALDLHHMVEVYKGGGNAIDNLLALCPTCHSMYHRGYVPQQAIRQWKERLVALYKGEVPGQPSSSFIMPSDFDWEPWYGIYDNTVYIHHEQYNFEDVVFIDEKYYDIEACGGRKKLLEDRLVVSPDRKSVAILIGSFFTPPFHGASEESLRGQRKLIIYSKDSNLPIHTSSELHYVYTHPAFSTNSKLVVYAFAHNWHDVEASYEYEGEVMKHDMGGWNESVCIFDIGNQSESIVVTEEVTGYGEWANPYNFMSLQFLQRDSVIFSTCQSDAGTTGTWNIYLDGTKPRFEANPRFFHGDDE
jgi:hypothetical protein